MVCHYHQELLIADSPLNDRQHGDHSHLSGTITDAPEDPTYILGRTETETRRLMLQAELYGRVMQQFLQDAGWARKPTA